MLDSLLVVLIINIEILNPFDDIKRQVSIFNLWFRVSRYKDIHVVSVQTLIFGHKVEVSASHFGTSIRTEEF